MNRQSLAIKVEDLSKQYRIGAREAYKTFRETLLDSAKAPFRRLKNIGRSMPKELVGMSREEIEHLPQCCLNCEGYRGTVGWLVDCAKEGGPISQISGYGCPGHEVHPDLEEWLEEAGK